MFFRLKSEALDQIVESKPGDWWAFSPFHDEKTPSFHMAAGGVWYDFSIGEGGGPIELVQRLEGGNCYEAGRLILERDWAHACVFRWTSSLFPDSTKKHKTGQKSRWPYEVTGSGLSAGRSKRSNSSRRLAPRWRETLPLSCSGNGPIAAFTSSRPKNR